MTYIPESYLMHHGVKGQKWGVRRYQNPDGTLTAEGRRRYGAEDVHPSEIKRQMKKKLKNESSDYQKTVASIQKKVNDEFDQTKEAKDAKAITEYLVKLEKDAKEQYGSNVQVVYDSDTALAINAVYERAQKKADAILAKYNDELAGATLRELNYEDTKEGRAWLIKNKLL